MADLIAQGPERRDRWRRPLPTDGQSRWLGRGEGVWSVPWDTCVSRLHAELRWTSHGLEVRGQEGARNPIFWQGNASREFTVPVGQHFVIGATRFTVVDQAAVVSMVAPVPDHQRIFAREALRRSSFREGQQQIQALSRLPEIMTGEGTDQELWVRLVNLLLTSISTARVAAVVGRAQEVAGTADHRESWRVLHWDRHEGVREGVFEPSARLIQETLESGQSVVHEWYARDDVGGVRENYDWAFCTPLSGQACRGSAIYVAGERASDETVSAAEGLHDALKFTELVSSTVGALCDARTLQRRTAALAPFFSLPVREAMAVADPEAVLAPRETEVCVLFCDLRGFSRRSEQAAGDLMGLLQRVSSALGIVTHDILEAGGVIGDFHGDAVMGFWGWPWTQADSAQRACRAALAIHAAFQAVGGSKNDPLHDFRAGIGIAYGRAVAGKIGTIDQVKVTALGPVVNVAARLEGLTRSLGFPILLDEPTARAVQAGGVTNTWELRAILAAQLYGMEKRQDVHALLLAAEWRDWQREQAWEHFIEGRARWTNGDLAGARQAFERLPEDRPLRRFLLDQCAKQDQRLLGEWDGTFLVTTK